MDAQIRFFLRPNVEDKGFELIKNCLLHIITRGMFFCSPNSRQHVHLFIWMLQKLDNFCSNIFHEEEENVATKIIRFMFVGLAILAMYF
jgi:hypothetical protein